MAPIEVFRPIRPKKDQDENMFVKRHERKIAPPAKIFNPGKLNKDLEYANIKGIYDLEMDIVEEMSNDVSREQESGFTINNGFVSCPPTPAKLEEIELSLRMPDLLAKEDGNMSEESTMNITPAFFISISNASSTPNNNLFNLRQSLYRNLLDKSEEESVEENLQKDGPN